ncbi:RNA 2',3'-cyclic phosphodiesterase [Streptomyces sp. 4N509B]|uniref:RNA 2',3'-cyclic phosphodiesterase n=1 Tax=Streptomyces sp. 4N509B TaxID=3457413 RepID=UPI003FD45074
MRFFTAILPPPAVADEVAAVVRDRLTPLPGADRLRWTARDGWHVTLAYYGEVPRERLAEVRERLAAVARAAGPFALRLAGGESLGEHALGTGVAGDRAALTALAAATADAYAHTDRRYPTYRPHLTLALAPRATADGDERVALAPYVAALRALAGSPWDVAELALMRTADEPGVASGVASGDAADAAPSARRYTTAASWPLTG